MFKIRLKTFVILATIAITLSSLGFWVYRSRFQQSLIQEIQSSGGTVLYHFQLNKDSMEHDSNAKPLTATNWLIQMLGHDYFCEVASVKFKSDPENFSLKKLGQLPKLIALRCPQGFAIGDSLSLLPSSLKLLQINTSKDESEQIAYFESIDRAVFVRAATNGSVSSLFPESFDRFGESKVLPNLESLSIDMVLNQNDIDFLKKHKKLTHLQIDQCSQHRNFSFLEEFPNLKTLNLAGCEEFDLADLSKLNNLDSLTIKGEMKPGTLEQLPPRLATQLLRTPADQTKSDLKTHKTGVPNYSLQGGSILARIQPIGKSKAPYLAVLPAGRICRNHSEEAFVNSHDLNHLADDSKTTIGRILATRQPAAALHASPRLP